MEACLSRTPRQLVGRGEPAEIGVPLSATLLGSFFAALMLSGVWKSLVEGFGMELPDITVVAAAGTTLCLLLHLWGKGLNFPRATAWPLAAFTGFIAWATVSYVQTSEYSVALIRLRSLVLCFFGFLVPILGFRCCGALFKAFLRLSAATLICFLLVFPMFYSVRAELAHSTMSIYLQAGYLAGLTCFLVFHGDVVGRKERMAVLVVCGLCLLVAGARGPVIILVAVAGGLGVLRMLNAGRMRVEILRQSWRFIGLLAVGVCVAIFIGSAEEFSELRERAFLRFAAVLGGERTSSVDERVSFFAYSVDRIFSSVGALAMGVGVGGFGPSYSGGADMLAHPHNAFLEVIFELGLIGLVFFVVVVACAVRNLEARANPFLLGACLYLIGNAMKSFSVADSRIMFGVLGLSLAALALNGRMTRSD